MATVPALHFTESFEAQINDLLMRTCVEFQLDGTRFKAAEKSYQAVGKLLESQSLVARLRPTIYPQGSMWLDTTVRPIVGDEYDLDFVCQFICSTEFFKHPDEALYLVERALRSSSVYGPMVERMNRCIRLNYAHQFHLDILPACKDPQNGNTCILVPDRKLGAWTPSNPIGYGAWFNERSRQIWLQTLLEKAAPVPVPQTAEQKPPLKLCVQLWKRWRDIRYVDDLDAAPISIVLTTLAGLFYRGEQSVVAAMDNILRSTVEATNASRSRLVVLNPSNPLEDLSERWDSNPRAYREFVVGVNEFRAQWQALQQARGIDKVALSLERLFGEEITKTVIEKQTGDIWAARASNRLAIKKASGMLAGLGAASVPVRTNTFYGD